MSFLINPYVANTPPTYTYNTRSIDTSNASSYTFTGLSIGAADTSRFVIVSFVGTAVFAGNPSITSVTIGGVTATLLAAMSSAGFSAIYGATVPTGTTANVVINLSSTVLQCAVATYSLYGLSSTTPYATATSSANPLSLNANTVGGAIVIGIAKQGQSTSTTFSWAGLTERWDEVVESSSLGWSGADDYMTSAETPRTVSVSFSSAPTTIDYGALVVMR